MIRFCELQIGLWDRDFLYGHRGFMSKYMVEDSNFAGKIQNLDVNRCLPNSSEAIDPHDTDAQESLQRGGYTLS